MQVRKYGLTATTVAVGVALSVLAAPASAATSPFSCRASVVRAAIPPAPVIEPFVANAADAPCTADTKSVLGPATVGPATVSVATATTNQTPPGGGPFVAGQGPTAQATVASAVISLPSTPPTVIALTGLQAKAAYTCNGRTGHVTPSGSATVATLNGMPVAPGPHTISLGGLGTLFLNQVTVSGHPDTITSRAVFLHTILGDVVIAEAKTDKQANFTC
jgi:hypothetical protein